ncbi:MAG TPA: hypothetical protein VHZ95_13875, partial [Polyangiales bacterium]|nr:hypothetical protein [Polyangiales bacterium]
LKHFRRAPRPQGLVSPEDLKHFRRARRSLVPCLMHRAADGGRVAACASSATSSAMLVLLELTQDMQ